MHMYIYICIDIDIHICACYKHTELIRHKKDKENIFQINISGHLMLKNYFGLLFQPDHITHCFYIYHFTKTSFDLIVLNSFFKFLFIIEARHVVVRRQFCVVSCLLPPLYGSSSGQEACTASIFAC